MNDSQLFSRFGELDLSAEEWTHEAHLRTAFLFLQQFPLDEAHLRMRAGILRLNGKHGLVETGMRGYAETLTRAWLALVAEAARRSGARHSEELLELCPELLDRTLVLRYYSRPLLLGVRARSIFVEPDLQPLPMV